MFGIEITADNGTSYLLQDASPFIFSHVITGTLQHDGGLVYKTKFTIPEIPTTTTLYPFFTYLASSANQIGYQEVTIENGVWTIKMSGSEACQVEVYLFVDKVIRPSSSPYGIQVYDDKGTLILDTGSKPMKVYLGLPGHTHSSKIAVPSVRSYMNKAVGTSYDKKWKASAVNNVIIENPYGIFDAIDTGASVYYENRHIPYIVCSEYV